LLARCQGGLDAINNYWIGFLHGISGARYSILFFWEQIHFYYTTSYRGKSKNLFIFILFKGKIKNLYFILYYILLRKSWKPYLSKENIFIKTLVKEGKKIIFLYIFIYLLLIFKTLLIRRNSFLLKSFLQVRKLIYWVKNLLIPQKYSIVE
jgi:hypothetical protein